MARELGIRTSGSKVEISDRIKATLAGLPVPDETPGKRVRLEGELSRATMIPEGVVLSRQLREWFESELGSGFRADRHLRDFLRNGAGRTLGDAADHYRATRDVEPSEIEPQFELNRFTRLWWKANPNGSPENLRADWREYRATPAELRKLPSK